MNTLQLELRNFRCWDNKTFKFTNGLNLISGCSGTGKSTICEAIFFALYGTLKNVGSKEKNENETQVICIYKSDILNFEIIRGRPSYLCVKTQEMELFKVQAQKWIESIFGSCNSWLASSYLSQESRHFLISSSNADKMNLFQEITFGDYSENNSPEYYITKIKEQIDELSHKVSVNSNVKNTYSKMVSEFHHTKSYYLQFGFISEDETKSQIIEKEKIEAEIAELGKKFYDMENAKKITRLLEKLKPVDFSEAMMKEKKDYERYFQFKDFETKLGDFDVRALTVNEEEHCKNFYLYSTYINAGYNPKKDITEFISKEKRNHDLYEKNKLKISKNKAIQERNKIRQKINDTKKIEYDQYLYAKDKINTLMKEHKISNPKEIDLDFSNDLNLYSKYIKNGWDPKTDFNVYYEKLQNQNYQYLEYIKNIEKNKDIESQNKQIVLENRYNSFVYENKYKEYLKYQTFTNFKNKNPIEKIPPFLNEQDDFTLQYAKEQYQNYTLYLKELICPHCKNGVYYENNSLKPGILNFSDKDKCLKIQEIAKKELEKRSKYVELEKNCSPTSEPDKIMDKELIPVMKLTEVKKVEIFEKPLLDYNFILMCIEFKKYYDQYLQLQHMKDFKFEEYEKEDEIEYVFASKINVFDIPTMEYQDVIKIENSRKNISLYNEMLKYQSDTYVNYDLSMVKTKYNELKRKETEYNKYIFQKQLYQKQLEALPAIDNKISEMVLQKKNILEILNLKILCGPYSRDYQSLIDKIHDIESQLFNDTQTYNLLIQMSKMVSELGTKFLQETIDDVNTSLRCILEDLFINPISVQVSSHRLLKNGNQKMEINLSVSYNGLTYDSIKFLSGGEKDRVSLALLLAFSRIKNSPFIILDEELASLDATLREKSLDIISKWCSGKIVIHICHEIVQGMHDHIINI